MIGKVNLNQQQIKSYLENYYKVVYDCDDIKILFYYVDRCPNDTGIVLLRNLNIGNENNDLVIEEYLENEELIEVFNSIFESEGYSIKEFNPEIRERGSGWDGCISLKSLKLTLEKENVKKRVKKVD